MSVSRSPRFVNLFISCEESETLREHLPHNVYCEMYVYCEVEILI